LDFEIARALPPTGVASALASFAVPKLASGSVVQLCSSQLDGASRIHSADETSGDDMCFVVL
jgi:hypothetical protein